MFEEKLVWSNFYWIIPQLHDYIIYFTCIYSHDNVFNYVLFIYVIFTTLGLYTIWRIVYNVTQMDDIITKV